MWVRAAARFVERQGLGRGGAHRPMRVALRGTLKVIMRDAVVLLAESALTITAAIGGPLAAAGVPAAPWPAVRAAMRMTFVFVRLLRRRGVGRHAGLRHVDRLGRARRHSRSRWLVRRRGRAGTRAAFVAV